MEYTTLGSTGISVSRLCLGCMSFGSGRKDWTLSKSKSEQIINKAIDLGINFFDTANIYSYGESEKILGETLDGYDRERLVVATKVYKQMNDDNPNSGGLSRKTITQELDNSLHRLGMDSVDLYQIHRWDYETRIEDTLRALDSAVQQGKAQYFGASSMWTYQFADAIHTSERLGIDRFTTMQNHYSLAYREEERDMLPFCQQNGIGVMPWSPLARGFLARPHREMSDTRRGETDNRLHERPYAKGGGREINERVEKIAEDKDVTMAQIALSWVLHKDWVDAPIIGTTSVEHLEQAVEAVDISLSSSEMEYLEEPYEPVPVAGPE